MTTAPSTTADAPADPAAPSPFHGTWSLFATLFLSMVAHAVGETARDALFLSRLSARQLAVAYMVIAGLSVGAAVAQRRGGTAPHSHQRALFRVLLSASAMNVGFHVVIGYTSEAGAFAYYVATGLVSTLALVRFWVVMGERVDVQRAKAVYGPMGAAGVGGAIVGSFLAGQLLRVVPPRDLLLVAAALFSAGAAVVRAIPARPHDAPLRHREVAAAQDTRRGYLGRLLVLGVTSSMALTLLDFAFKLGVTEHFEGDAAAIGSFMAHFHGSVNVVALGAQVLVATPLLRAVGAGRSLLVLPSLLLVGLALVLAGPMGSALFGLALVKATDGSLRHSLHRSASEVLYLPLPEATRARFKSIADTVGQRGGQGLAALVLIACVAVGPGYEHILYIATGLIMVWFAAGVGIQRVYVDLFRRNIEERSLAEHASLGDIDLHTLEVLLESLGSEDDAKVLSALDLLNAFGRASLIPPLILYHPSNDVVYRALEIFGDHADERFLPAARRTVHSPDPAIRAASLRAIDRVAPAPRLLEDALADTSPVVRATALVGLAVLHAAHVQGALRPGDGAKRMSRMSLAGFGDRRTLATSVTCPCDHLDIPGALTECTQAIPLDARVALARAIAQRPNPVFWNALQQLARGAEPEVRAAVASAVAKLPDARFAPILVPWVADGHAREPARQALVAMGAAGFDAVSAALSDVNLPHPVRRHLPRTLSRFPIEWAWPRLMEALEAEVDDAVRYKILRGLGRLRASHPGYEAPRPALEALLLRTLRQAAGAFVRGSLLEAHATAHPTPTAELLLLAVREHQAASLGRAFRVMGLIWPEEDFRLIYQAALGGNPRSRSDALELLEHVLTGTPRAMTLALLKGAPREQQRAALAAYVDDEPSDDLAATVAKMRRHGSFATRAIADHFARENGMSLDAA